MTLNFSFLSGQRPKSHEDPKCCRQSKDNVLIYRECFTVARYLEGCSRRAAKKFDSLMTKDPFLTNEKLETSLVRIGTYLKLEALMKQSLKLLRSLISYWDLI